MKTYYQVSYSFKLTEGTPSLVKISLNSSYVYYPFLIIPSESLLSHSMYFYTLTEANNYIDHLFSRYPECGLKRPALDAEQPLLF